MATDLPGIRARAEWDLEKFRQQEAELKASLQRIAEEMRSIPSARITIDTSQARQQTQDAVNNVKTAQEQLTRANATGNQARVNNDKKAIAESERIFKQWLKDQEEANLRSNQALIRANNERIAAVKKAEAEFIASTKKEIAAMQERDRQAAKAAREQAGQDRREARAAIPTGIGVGAIGAGITKELIDATSAAADFEKAMSQVRAVMSPEEIAKSGAQFEELALTLGRSKLGASAIDAASALEAMTKAGIEAKDQLSGAPAVLALAAAGTISVGDAAELAATSIQTFKLSGEDLTHVANILVGVANATTTDIDKLRQSFAQTAAVAKLHNQTIDDTAIALGLMAQAGIRSSDAGTSLRVMLLRLQPETTKQMAIMQRYGLIADGTNKFINEQTGQFKSLAEVAAILNTALKDASDAEKEFALRTLFGQDAVRAAVVLTNAGAEGFAKLAAEANAQGDAVRVANERLNNLRGDLQNLNNVWKEVQITFNKGLETDLRGPVQQITKLLEAAIQLDPAIKSSSLAVAAAIGVVFSLGGAAVTAAAGAKLLGFTAAALTVTVGGLITPILAVAAAVAVLGVAWVNNWGDIQGKTKTVADTIGEFLKRVEKDIRALRDILSTPFEIGPIKFGTGGEDNDPVLKFFQFIVDKAKEAGEQSGINFAEAFKRMLISQLPAGDTFNLVDDLLKPRRDANEQIDRVKKQEEAQREIDTPELIDSERQRIAETILAQKEEVKNALVEVYADGFRAVQESATAKGGGGVAGREFAESFRERVKEAFPDVGEDITNTIVTAIELAGQDKITPAAEQAADAFKTPWERALKDLDRAGQDFGKAFTLAFTDVDAIQALLQMQEASDAAATGLKKLTDDGLKAALIAELNLAESMPDGTAKIEARIAVGQKFLDHLEAQEKTAKDAAAAQKLADDIASTGAKLYEERARDLITQTYPALNAASREYVERLLKQGEATKAAQFAITAIGGDASNLEEIMQGTGAAAGEYAEQLKKIAAASDVAGNASKITNDRASEFLSTIIQDLPAATQAQIEFTNAVVGPGPAIAQAYEAIGLPLSQIPDFANLSAKQVKELTDQFNRWKEVSDPVARAAEITKDRYKEFLDTVIKDMPAAARAQVEMVAVAQGPVEGLRKAYQLLGLDISKLPDLANASATSLKQIQQSIEANKFFNETGKLLPASKPPDAVKTYTEAVGKANADLAKARDDLNKSLADNQKKLQESVQQANKDLAQAEEEYSNAIADADRNLAEANAEIDAAIEEAIDKYEAAIAKLDRKEEELWDDAARKWEERGVEAAESRKKVYEDLAKTLDDINAQITDAVFKATEAQRKQLADLAASLAKLRVQEADAARSASVTLEDLALREMQAQTAEERQAVAKERVRLQAEQGAQAVALQKEITKGQADLHQDVEKTQADLLKQVADLQKQAKEAVDKAVEQLIKIDKDLAEADEKAARDFEKQLYEIEQQRVEAREARDKQLRELQKRREEARKQAEEAKKKAEERLKQAKEQHDEAIRKAEEAKRDADEKAREQFKDAQRKHAEAMAKADEDLRLSYEQLNMLRDIKHVGDRQLETLEDIKALRQPYVINLNNSNIEEGDVEFLERAAEEARRMALEAIT